MPVLYLMRHASAEPHDPAGDALRALTADGRAEASSIGDQLRDAGIDRVLASSAARTLQTALELGLDVEAEPADSLYNADGETILEAVRLLDDSVTTALVIAHNPGISDASLELTGDDSDPEARLVIESGFPPATCCRFEVTGSWASLTTARLTTTLRPH